MTHTGGLVVIQGGHRGQEERPAAAPEGVRQDLRQLAVPEECRGLLRGGALDLLHLALGSRLLQLGCGRPGGRGKEGKKEGGRAPVASCRASSAVGVCGVCLCCPAHV